MTDLIFNIPREEAAAFLSISTRTLDRYVKKWKLSYKRQANRVLFDQQQIQQLKVELEEVKQETPQGEIFWVQDMEYNLSNSGLDLEQFQQTLNQSLQGFQELLLYKDKLLEEKNETILWLNSMVSQLEAKLSSSIALPDYSKEKELSHLENQKMQIKAEQLSHEVQGLKLKYFISTAIVFLLLLFIIGFALFFKMI